MIKKLVLTLLAIAGLAAAQTKINGGRTVTGGAIDFSAASSTKPDQQGSTLPATCIIGQMFYDIVNTHTYRCTAPNTWTQMDGGGSGGSSLFTSYQFGTQPALTGFGLYLQTTYPNIFTTTQTGSGTSGSPYVDAITLASQSQNQFLASPNGSAGPPVIRAIVAADIPTLNQNTTGNAATATALAATPSVCSVGQAPTGIIANGNSTGCATIINAVSGTTRQITASTVSGTVILSLPNNLLFPGTPTFTAATTGGASFNMPPGVAPTAPNSGDFWNLAGSIQFFDGSTTRTLSTGGFTPGGTQAAGKVPIATGPTTSTWQYPFAIIDACATAVCDGTTDDHVAVAAALALIPATGGELFFSKPSVNLGTVGLAVPYTQSYVCVVGSPTTLIYTGTANDLAFGTSAHTIFGPCTNNLILDISGAGSAAVGLYDLESFYANFNNTQVKTVNGLSSATGQTALFLDGGPTSGTFSAYTNLNNVVVSGDFTIGQQLGSAVGAGQVNQTVWTGGAIVNNMSAPGSASKGVWIKSGDTNAVAGKSNIEGWVTGLQIESGSNGPLQFRFEGNTLDVLGTANCTINDLGTTTISTITDNCSIGLGYNSVNNGGINLLKTAKNLTMSGTGRLDASGALSTAPMKVGLAASKPATCVTGDSYFATDATAGQQIFECSSTNTWTQQLNSGSAGIAPYVGTFTGPTITVTAATHLQGIHPHVDVYDVTTHSYDVAQIQCKTAGGSLVDCPNATSNGDVVITGTSGVSYSFVIYGASGPGANIPNANITFTALNGTMNWNHNLNTLYPVVSCWYGSAEVVPNLTVVDANNITISTPTATTGGCSANNSGGSGPPGVAGPPGAGATLTVPNDASTGTTLNSLAIINSSGNAIKSGTSNTAVPVWIVTGGAGTTGSATLSAMGLTTCTMDAGGSTAGHFIVNSTTTAGRCSDGGATAPTGVFVFGIAQTTVAANATASIAQFAGFIGVGSGGGGLGSAACSAITVTGGAATLVYSSTVNCNYMTIVATTTITLPTPSGSGQYQFQITNSGPVTGANIAYAGATQTGLPTTIDASANNAVTTVLMHYANGTWVFDGATSSTATPLSVGQIYTQSATGPPIAAVASNVTGLFSGCSGLAPLGSDGNCHVFTGRATAQTAAVSSIVAHTVGASDGSFTIAANVNITTSTAFSFTVTVTYTDETNTSRVLTLNFSELSGTFVTSITNVLGAGAYAGVPLSIRCKAGTTITIATAAGGTYTTVTYNVEGFITQIA